MARNLILGDPSEGSWCVYGQIGTIGDQPQHILAFYKTEEDAEEAIKSLREKFGGRISVRIFEYDYAADELDLMKLMLLDGIHMAIQYLVG
mgnify:CR=1 FL=1